MWGAWFWRDHSLWIFLCLTSSSIFFSNWLPLAFLVSTFWRDSKLSPWSFFYLSYTLTPLLSSPDLWLMSPQVIAGAWNSPFNSQVYAYISNWTYHGQLRLPWLKLSSSSLPFLISANTPSLLQLFREILGVIFAPITQRKTVIRAWKSPGMKGTCILKWTTAT